MKEGKAIRRILVALDASPASLEGLKAAVALAERARAELAGIFIEDVNLLRAAELPIAREICFFSPALRRLDAGRLEQQLRAQAEGVRQALAAMAGQRRIDWTFRTVRGAVARELIAAAEPDDLIILGRIGRSLMGAGRVGSTVRAVITRPHGWTMILHRTLRKDPPVLVYDGSDSAAKALAAAGYFMEEKDAPMAVFLLADTKEAAGAFRTAVSEHLEGSGFTARFQPLISSAPAVLAHFVKLSSTGPVLLPGERWEGREGELLELVNTLPNPILVVR